MYAHLPKVEVTEQKTNGLKGDEDSHILVDFSANIEVISEESHILEELSAENIQTFGNEHSKFAPRSCTDC